MKIKSKKALVYDAKFQKSGVIITKLNSSSIAPDGSSTGFFQDFAEVETTTPEGGTMVNEISLPNNSFLSETFSAQEIEAQNDKVSAEQQEGLSFKEKNDLVLYMAYLEKYKTTELYGAPIIDWEIVE